MQHYTYASSCKDVGNIPESHSVKAFAALLSHLVSSNKTVLYFQCFISIKGTGKKQLEPGQESEGDALVFYCSWLRNP